MKYRYTDATKNLIEIDVQLVPNGAGAVPASTISVNGVAVAAADYPNIHAEVIADLLGGQCNVERLDGAPLLACPDCGCTDVQTTAWVHANTGFNTNDEAPAEYAYCPQCENSDIRDRDLVDTTEPKPYVEKAS